MSLPEGYRSASQMARIVNHARAEQRKAERKDAVAKTMAEFGASKMRSRAKVVAPVKAARTRKQKQKSGAESAA